MFQLFASWHYTVFTYFRVSYCVTGRYFVLDISVEKRWLFFLSRDVFTVPLSCLRGRRALQGALILIVYRVHRPPPSIHPSVIHFCSRWHEVPPRRQARHANGLTRHHSPINNWRDVCLRLLVASNRQTVRKLGNKRASSGRGERKPWPEVGSHSVDLWRGFQDQGWKLKGRNLKRQKRC